MLLYERSNQWQNERLVRTDMKETHIKRVMKSQHLLMSAILTTEPTICFHMTLRISNVIKFSNIMLFLWKMTLKKNVIHVPANRDSILKRFQKLHHNTRQLPNRREHLVWTLGRTTGNINDFLWFSPVPSSKCWDSITIRTSPLPNSFKFIIHESPYYPVLHSFRYWQQC